MQHSTVFTEISDVFVQVLATLFHFAVTTSAAFFPEVETGKMGEVWVEPAGLASVGSRRGTWSWAGGSLYELVIVNVCVVVRYNAEGVAVEVCWIV